MTSTIRVQCPSNHPQCHRELTVRPIEGDETSQFDVERSVFVSGIPPQFHVKALQSLMSCFGDVESVIFPDEISASTLQFSC
jgi:hypothetical protein